MLMEVSIWRVGRRCEVIHVFSRGCRMMHVLAGDVNLVYVLRRVLHCIQMHVEISLASQYPISFGVATLHRICVHYILFGWL